MKTANKNTFSLTMSEVKIITEALDALSFLEIDVAKAGGLAPMEDKYFLLETRLDSFNMLAALPIAEIISFRDNALLHVEAIKKLTAEGISTKAYWKNLNHPSLV